MFADDKQLFKHMMMILILFGWDLISHKNGQADSCCRWGLK